MLSYLGCCLLFGSNSSFVSTSNNLKKIYKKNNAKSAPSNKGSDQWAMGVTPLNYTKIQVQYVRVINIFFICWGGDKIGYLRTQLYTEAIAAFVTIRVH